MKYLHFSLAALLVIASWLTFAPLSASAACIDLQSNLSSGSSDSVSVMSLQNFLASTGYLSARPNGTYGPATLAAVKRFQAQNGIPTTGSAGSMTRAAIRSESCGTSASTISTGISGSQSSSVSTGISSSVVTSDVAVSDSAPVQAPVFNPDPQPSATALAPLGGETLSLGESYWVRWTGPSGIMNYNVILEDQYGTPQGFIVAGSYAKQVSWKVGQVHTSQSADPVTVPPGKYRVHIEDAAAGPQSSDRLSGYFTIASTMRIDQIFPSAAPSDGTTAIVMTGSGFTSLSQIDLSGYGSVMPAFVSGDGKVIVFSVPMGVSSGTHYASVINTFNGSDVRTTSNSARLSVSRP